MGKKEARKDYHKRIDQVENIQDELSRVKKRMENGLWKVLDDSLKERAIWVRGFRNDLRYLRNIETQLRLEIATTFRSGAESGMNIKNIADEILDLGVHYSYIQTRYREKAESWEDPDKYPIGTKD